VICLVNSDNERDSPLLTSRLDLDSNLILASLRVVPRVTLGVAVRVCGCARCAVPSGAVRVCAVCALLCDQSLGSFTPSPPLMIKILLRGIHGTETVRD